MHAGSLWKHNLRADSHNDSRQDVVVYFTRNTTNCVSSRHVSLLTKMNQNRFEEQKAFHYRDSLVHGARSILPSKTTTYRPSFVEKLAFQQFFRMCMST